MMTQIWVWAQDALKTFPSLFETQIVSKKILSNLVVETHRHDVDRYIKTTNTSVK